MPVRVEFDDVTAEWRCRTGGSSHDAGRGRCRADGGRGRPDASAVAFAAHAILAALDDAGVALEDVEGGASIAGGVGYDFPGLLRVRAALLRRGPDGLARPALVRLAAMAVCRGSRACGRLPRPRWFAARARAAVVGRRAAASASIACRLPRGDAPALAGDLTRAPVRVLASLRSRSRVRPPPRRLAREPPGGVLAPPLAGSSPTPGRRAVDVACLYDSPQALVRLALDTTGSPARASARARSASAPSPRRHRRRGRGGTAAARRADDQAGARWRWSRVPAQPTSAVLLGVER
jgi:hypothetical protein